MSNKRKLRCTERDCAVVTSVEILWDNGDPDGCSPNFCPVCGSDRVKEED